MGKWNFPLNKKKTKFGLIYFLEANCQTDFEFL